MKREHLNCCGDTVIVRKLTILGSFIFGWGLTIAGFIVPPTGVIDNTVLVVLGQALTYVAVGVGLKTYADVQDDKITKLIHKTSSDETK